MSTTSNQPARGYFSRAASEFSAAWCGGRAEFGNWCLKFWPFPVAAFVLALLAVGWAVTPGAPPVQERFRERLEASGNWSDLRWVQAEPKKDGPK